MGCTKTIACFFFAMALFGATMAADYKVGDDAGWATGVDYAKWASKYTFRKGDTLRFTWKGKYSVVNVKKEGYEKCKAGFLNLPWAWVNSPESFTLIHSGDHYFISNTPWDACKNGMKLHIKVLLNDAMAPTKPTSHAPPTAALSLSTLITLSFCLVVFLALAY